MSSVYHKLVVLFWAVVAVLGGSLEEKDDGGHERSVKKELNDSAETQMQPNNTGSGVRGRKMPMDLLTLKPEMFQTFYVFLGVSFVLILLIVYRLFKLRSHRAERKYGVKGDRAEQELTPLPTAMMEDDESELEDDETLFDINKTRVYVA